MLLKISKIFKIMTISLITISISCSSSKSDDSSDEEAAAGGVTTSGVVVKTKLTAIFPSELAVVSPYTVVDGTNDLTTGVTFLDYKSEVSRTWTKINADQISQCIRNFSDVATSTPPSCFGPAIEYQGHPDGAPAIGEFIAGELGIWSSITTEKEACSAAKLNYEIDSLKAHFDLGLDAIKLLVCAGQIAGQEQPKADGDTLDLTVSLKDVLKGQAIGGVFNSASITRSKNSDDQVVFTSKINITRDDESVLAANIRHVLIEANNSVYKGKFWMQIDPKSGSGDKISSSSILYSKASETDFKMEFRKTEFPEASASTDIFDGNDSLKKQLDSSGYSWGVFSFDPQTTVGKYAYLWVDGDSTQNVRSLVADITAGSDVNESCAYLGNGGDLATVFASSTRAGWLDRMACNLSGPGGTSTGIASVQKQCMKQDKGSGLYEVSENKIGYIPRNTCGAASDDNSGFSWRIKGATTFYNSFSSVNSLAPISGLASGTLTVPVMPTDL